jgi:hypothetical protein
MMQRMIFTTTTMHIITWTVCAVLTGLPYIDCSTGRIFNNEHVAVCFAVTSNSTLYSIWNVVGWMFMEGFCCVVMVLFLVHIKVAYWNAVGGLSSDPVAHSLWTCLSKYPITFMLLNMPFFFTQSILFYYPISSRYVLSCAISITSAVAALSGAVLALIFYSYSKDARLQWWRLLNCIRVGSPLSLDRDSAIQSGKSFAWSEGDCEEDFLVSAPFEVPDKLARQISRLLFRSSKSASHRRSTDNNSKVCIDLSSGSNFDDSLGFGCKTTEK